MTATNVVITNSSASKIVTIATDKVEWLYSNNLGNPISEPSTGATKTATTKIVNLNKFVERYVIDGAIATGLGTSDTNTNASDKRDDLQAISKVRAVKGTANTQTTMTYDGTSYNITFEKISIREDAQDLPGGEAPDGVMRYVVKLSVIVGDPII